MSLAGSVPLVAARARAICTPAEPIEITPMFLIERGAPGEEADPLEGGDPAVPSGMELGQMFDRDGFRDHCDGQSTRNQ
jgi:hypothetical protein